MSVKELLVVLLVTTGANVTGTVQTKTVEYKEGETVLEGFAAWDDKSDANRPGILIVHDWMGLQENPKEVALRLAELGYVAFALDIYGKGIRPKDTKEASAAAGLYYGDRELYRRRLNAGLKELRAIPQTSSDAIAAIGYCFGGAGVLELARSGADVKGVVSFHGSLVMKGEAKDATVTSKILVLHGVDDPYVPWTDVSAFKDEMNAKKADWQFIGYSGAVHSFTNKRAGSDASKGSAYNENADKRSWQAMSDFFDELF